MEDGKKNAIVSLTPVFPLEYIRNRSIHAGAVCAVMWSGASSIEQLTVKRPRNASGYRGDNVEVRVAKLAARPFHALAA